MTTLAEVYDEGFYRKQMAGSLRSAAVILDELFRLYRPDSVLDLGCGRGTWLRAALDLGVGKVAGVDGAWVVPEALVIPPPSFVQADMEGALPDLGRFDLAISVEVIEHLSDPAGRRLIARLTGAADVVLFSGAIPYQGGDNHINEQWQSHWAGIFRSHGYSCTDCIRPAVWNNPEVEWWYAQNVLVYTRDGSPAARHFPAPGKPALLDIAHPRRYASLGNEIESLRNAACRRSVYQRLLNRTRKILRRRR